MRYATVCSGIEAPSVAWHSLGWEPVFFSEIEPFPCAVLAHHYPKVPNLGDMTKFKDWPDATFDVLCGGTPCQSFSVAGLRKGLADPRGNLTLTYLAVAHKYRPRWLVWENVPGVLSDGTGAFGAFLGGLAELGYGFAYRILDAQYCGVPQRRRRVFVVGHLGDWRAAAAVLFELESLRGDPAPRREARERVAGTLRSGPAGGRSHGKLNGSDRVELVASHDVAQPLLAKANSSHRADAESYVAIAPEIARCVATREGTSQDWVGHAGSHANAGGQVAVAFHPKASRTQSMNPSEISPTLGTTKEVGALHHMQVRRLTPRECERLQGLPDDYTLIPYRGKHAKDGPRYKALGNSMAVPVMRWIGQRIASLESDPVWVQPVAIAITV